MDGPGDSVPGKDPAASMHLGHWIHICVIGKPPDTGTREVTSAVRFRKKKIQDSDKFKFQMKLIPYMLYLCGVFFSVFKIYSMCLLHQVS